MIPKQELLDLATDFGLQPNQSFVPRYAIELTDAGPLSAPALERERGVSRAPTRALGAPKLRRGNPFGSTGPMHCLRQDFQATKL